MALQRSIPRSYTHTQTTASDTWTIVHNVGLYPIVDAWTTIDNQLTKLLPLEVIYVDENTCTLTFSAAVDGFATVA
jgi:hypothetical protein